MPFFNPLNLRAAGRLSDYSTVGSVKTYSLGADWNPIEDVRLRGTFARRFARRTSVNCSPVRRRPSRPA